jgi:acyl dehydratase
MPHEPIAFANLAALEAATAAKTVLASDWHTIDQATIDAFAEATGDRQWIHSDPARAERDSPFGTTIAHGLLSLGLLPMMIVEALTIESATMTINYGFDRVRFVSPVPVGATLRATFVLASVERAPTGSRMTWNVTLEIAGGMKPALVAQWIAQIIERV